MILFPLAQAYFLYSVIRIPSSDSLPAAIVPRRCCSDYRSQGQFESGPQAQSTTTTSTRPIENAWILFGAHGFDLGENRTRAKSSILTRCSERSDRSRVHSSF